jgi:hypothetical protein
MRRRDVLLAAGALGTAGTVGVSSTLVGDLEVRWWATPRAARHPLLPERVEGYLRKGFERLALGVNVSFGGVVSVPTDDAYRLVIDGLWPRRVLTGVAGDRVDPVDDVNVLITDDSMVHAPTGAAIPYVAAIGGAGEIARAPPADSVDAVVPDTFVMRTIQILIHECGHTLGLRHDHGSIRERESGVVVSPMISGYAWGSRAVDANYFDEEANRCGLEYPDTLDGPRRLGLRFDDCERRGIYRYRLEQPTGPIDDLPDDLGDLLPECATCGLTRR